MHVEIAEQLTAIAQDARTLEAENARMRVSLIRISIEREMSYEPHEGADVELHRSQLCDGVWTYSNMPVVHRFGCALSTLTNGGEGNG